MNNKTEIKILKLSTGLEIIGELVETRTNVYRVKNPLIVIVDTRSQNVTVMFVPFSLLSDDEEVTIQNHQVMTILNPRLDVMQNYKAQLSKLALPSSPKLIIPGAS